MKPAIVFPYNDPDGMMFPHLMAILPDLRDHFERAYISPPPATLEWLEQTDQIRADAFFTVFPISADKDTGEHFAELYQRTAETAPSNQPLHLCFIDRLSFALETDHRSAFLSDITTLAEMNLPLVFQRSSYAWETHPQNYRDLEAIVTTVGKNLFGRELDYAWCHLVVTAGRLREIMPHVRDPKISMVAEVLLYLKDEVQTRDIDWLAWEDPFIFGRDQAELKQERENSLAETKKRLNYVLPMLDSLTRFSKNGRK